MAQVASSPKAILKFHIPSSLNYRACHGFQVLSYYVLFLLNIYISVLNIELNIYIYISSIAEEISEFTALLIFIQLLLPFESLIKLFV